MPGIVAGCYYLLRLLPSKGGCATTFCTHLSSATFQHFGTSITNAYSTHFVKSSGLNAKAKFKLLFQATGQQPHKHLDLIVRLVSSQSAI
jgi:hypothetical protein